jgi:hypothetical protein
MTKKRSERGYYRGLYSAIFDSPEYLGLTPDTRDLIVYLRMSPQYNQPGLFLFYREPVLKHTGDPLELIEKGLQELQETKWIKQADGLLWIVNGLKYDPMISLNNENHRIGIIDALKGLPRSPLVAEHIKYYGLTQDVLALPNGIGDGMVQGIGNGMVHHMGHQDKDKDKEEEKEKDLKDPGASLSLAPGGYQSLSEDWQKVIDGVITNKGWLKVEGFSIYRWIGFALKGSSKHPPACAEAILWILNRVDPRVAMRDPFAVLTGYLTQAGNEARSLFYKQQEKTARTGDSRTIGEVLRGVLPPQGKMGQPDT